jgi:hypothetical protein
MLIFGITECLHLVHNLMFYNMTSFRDIKVLLFSNEKVESSYYLMSARQRKCESPDNWTSHLYFSIWQVQLNRLI